MLFEFQDVACQHVKLVPKIVELNALSAHIRDVRLNFESRDASHVLFCKREEPKHARAAPEVKHFVVSEGYAEVNREMVLVVCNSAEWAENINIRWIFEAYEEAKKAIEEEKASGLTKTHTEDSKHKLSRAQARIHFISQYGSDAQKQRLEQLKETLV